MGRMDKEARVKVLKQVILGQRHVKSDSDLFQEHFVNSRDGEKMSTFSKIKDVNCI